MEERAPPRYREQASRTRRKILISTQAGALAPDACDRARDAVNACFDAGKTTDRGVSLPTQDVLVSSLPQRSQDEIREALEASASRASDELPPEIRLEFSMARAFCIVYDAGGQKGLKKHTDGRKEGATLLLLLSTPGVDFEGGGTRFFPSVLEPSFDAKPSKGSTVVFPSDTLQHEGLPIKRGRRLLVCVFATKKKRQGGPRAAETTACECRPGPGCSVDASDVEDPCARPPEPTSCADPCKSMDGAEVGASECACVVS